MYVRIYLYFNQTNNIYSFLAVREISSLFLNNKIVWRPTFYSVKKRTYHILAHEANSCRTDFRKNMPKYYEDRSTVVEITFGWKSSKQFREDADHLKRTERLNYCFPKKEVTKNYGRHVKSKIEKDRKKFLPGTVESSGIRSIRNNY